MACPPMHLACITPARSTFVRAHWFINYDLAQTNAILHVQAHFSFVSQDRILCCFKLVLCSLMISVALRVPLAVTLLTVYRQLQTHTQSVGPGNTTHHLWDILLLTFNCSRFCRHIWMPFRTNLFICIRKCSCPSASPVLHFTESYGRPKSELQCLIDL